MNSEFLNALDEIEKGKNISKDILLDAIDAALVSAYKRNYNTNHNNVVVNIDRESGEVKVYKQKEVVEVVEDDFTQISLDEAKGISGTYEIGDLVSLEEKPADFGRIAAQTAKQVVMQRIKEAERTLIFDEFSEKEHKLVNGVVQRIEKKNIYLAVVVAAIVCPVVNTGVFYAGCFAFFLDTIKEWAIAEGYGSNFITYMLLGLAGGNFLVELVSNIVLSPVVVRLLNIRKKANV